MSSLDLRGNRDKSAKNLKIWLLMLILCAGILVYFVMPNHWNKPLSAWGSYASILGTGVSIWVLKNAQTISQEIQNALKKYGLYYTAPDMRGRLDTLIKNCEKEDMTVSSIRSEARALLAPLNHLANSLSSEVLLNTVKELALDVEEITTESKKSKNTLIVILTKIYDILSLIG